MPQPIAFAPYLNVKHALSPTFSADGSRLLYLSDITGTFQVWSVSVHGGWPDQLTFYDDRITGLHSPRNGDYVIITRDEHGNEKDQIFLLQGGADRGVEITALVEDWAVKHNWGAWRPDGRAIAFSSNRREPAHFDVYTLDLEDGAQPQPQSQPKSQPKMVFQADANLYPVAWSRSGRYLLVQRMNSNLDVDLFLLDLQTPGSEPRLLTPHTGAVRYEQARFSADDRGLYLVTDRDRDFTALTYLDLDSLELKVIAAPEWDIEGVHLSPDGCWLAYTVNENGAARLTVREVATGSEKRLEFPPGIIAGVAWSRDSRRLAFDFSSPVHNSDIWLYDLAQAAPVQVTHSPRGGLNPQTFIAPQPVSFESFDGLRIPALWFLPSDAPDTLPGDKLPTIVYVHGGPESQFRYIWNPMFQYFLQRGFAIFAPNVRGSAGYGKHYLSLDDVRKRMDSVADLSYAVKWLKQNPHVDPDKIVVYGGSYGGFMVLSALTAYPDLWAAGVDIVGISNMVTFLKNTSSYRRKLREAEYGSLENDIDFLEEISPIHKSNRITAPLMVIHGAQDPRVPVTEAEQLVESLRQQKRRVEYLRFEDEGHGIVTLKNRLVMYPKIADFLDSVLKMG